MITFELKNRKVSHENNSVELSLNLRVQETLFNFEVMVSVFLLYFILYV